MGNFFSTSIGSIVNSVAGRTNTNTSMQSENGTGRKNVTDKSEDSKIDILQTVLRGMYCTLDLPNVPWLDQGKSLVIGTYYVQLQLSNTEKIIPLDDLFEKTTINPNLTMTRILIEGQPGYGKTTLCHKLVYDWANGEKYIQQFKIAFLIMLRHLQGDSVMTRINELVDGSDEKETWKLINNEDTLLVLDGLDELGEDARIDMLRILYQPRNKMAIVATSRTGQFRLSPDDKEQVFKGLSVKKEFHNKQITILGVSNENRLEFLSKFIKDEDKTKTLENVQKISQSVTKIFESPLLLILLVYVIDDIGEIKIDTITDLYKILCDCVIKRNASKQNETESVQDFSLFSTPNNDTAKNYVDLFIKFGKLSIEHLFANNLQFNADSVTDKIYGMGFFTKSTAMTNFCSVCKYEGFHLSIVEFSAAYALFSDYIRNSKTFTPEAIANINRIYYAFNSKCLVFPFLSGLLGEDVRHLFECLIPYSVLYSTNCYHLTFILQECKIKDDLSQITQNFGLRVLSAKCLASEACRKNIELGIEYGGLAHLQIYSSEMHVLPKDCSNVSIWVTVTDEIAEEMWVEKRLKCKKILFEFGNEVRSVQTIERVLDMFNSIRSEEKILHIANSNLHQKVVYCLKKNLLKDTIITHLYCKSTDDPAGKELIEHVIKTNKLRGLRLKIESVKLLDIILDLVSESIHLDSLNLVGNVVELSKLLQNENKKWRELSLSGVKITCSSPFTKQIPIPSTKCTDYFTSNNVLLYSTKPRALHCDGRYILDMYCLSPYWDGWNSVQELTVILNDSLVNLFQYLSKFKHLVTLSIDINVNLTNESLNCIVESEIIHRVKHVTLQWSEDGSECSVKIVRRILELIDKGELNSINEFSMNITHYRFYPVTNEFCSMLKSLLRCVDCHKTVNIISNDETDLNQIVTLFADFNMTNFLKYNVEHKTDENFSTDFIFINHIISISSLN